MLWRFLVRKIFALDGVLFGALVGVLFAVLFAAPSAVAALSDWYIKKESWSAADERGFSEFVLALGESKCRTVDQCLKSPANPYRKSDPPGVNWDADCGKFPYLLRGYYAWKNGLPFSYAADVAPAGEYSSYDANGNLRPMDVRYSVNGNVVTRRYQIVQKTAGSPLNAIRELRLMQNEVNTAMYRIHPLRDGSKGRNFPDFYSVGIERSSLRPGTVMYDAAGHATIVYKVESDGRIRYFDAHPDRTVSRGVYGAKFARSRPAAGAGFKNFRPLQLVGATRGARNELIGGTVVSQPISSLPGFSVEQYWGTAARAPLADKDWVKAKFQLNGRSLNFFDFVRQRMAGGNLRFHPVVEMQNGIEALCGDLQDRAIAINTSIASGVQNKAHPERLPNNIYGTDGEWEEYSSPSRDARLRTSFRELRVRVQEMVEMYRRGDPNIEYDGSDLPGDLRRAYVESTANCKVDYLKSNRTNQTLSYDEIVDRLFDLSFDPYHCIELRWGAKGEELSSCRDSALKLAWFTAERRLRNQLERTYDVRMNFSLQDLQNRVPNSGVDEAPDVDLKAFLESL